MSIRPRRHTPLRLGQQVTAWSHLPADIEAKARAASMIDPVNPCLDVETEADMARAYYEALQTHLRAHGCNHDFADIADDSGAITEQCSICGSNHDVESCPAAEWGSVSGRSQEPGSGEPSSDDREAKGRLDLNPQTEDGADQADGVRTAVGDWGSRRGLADEGHKAADRASASPAEGAARTILRRLRGQR